MVHRLFILGFLFVMALGAIPGATSAQSLRLPTDLLFSTGTAADDYLFFHAFARVDADTLKTDYFYIDDTARATYMRPVSWSPSGQYLAFLTLADWSVCVLTRSGALQGCFQDKVSRWERFRSQGKTYTLTWSEDEQKAYFVADNGHTRRLIEADVATGQTQRTLYQVDTQGEFPPMIYWTPDLNYAATYNEGDLVYGAGFREEVRVEHVTTINLRTQEVFDMPAELPDLGTLVFCDRFSPLGHYLTAQTYMDPQHPGFAVFDPQGNVISTISAARLGEFNLTWVYCPTWQADEQAFYFLAGSYDSAQSSYTASIIRYSLLEDTLLLYAQIEPPPANHEIGSGGYPVSPLVASPEGAYIAIQFGDMVLGPGELIYEVGVLFPTGELIRFNDSFLRGLNPLWIPPLSE
jgi:hypothetical protein